MDKDKETNQEQAIRILQRIMDYTHEDSQTRRELEYVINLIGNING
jgi:hypothetical protein